MRCVDRARARPEFDSGRSFLPRPETISIRAVRMNGRTRRDAFETKAGVSMRLSFSRNGGISGSRERAVMRQYIAKRVTPTGIITTERWQRYWQSDHVERRASWKTVAPPSIAPPTTRPDSHEESGRVVNPLGLERRTHTSSITSTPSSTPKTPTAAAGTARCSPREAPSSLSRPR